MSANLVAEILSVCAFCCLGMAYALLFKLIYIVPHLFRGKKARKTATLLCDCVFSVLLISGVYLFNYAYLYGCIKLYCYASLLLGFVIFKYSFCALLDIIVSILYNRRVKAKQNESVVPK